MATTSREIAVATELLARKQAEISLYEFAKQAWHIVEGKRPFVDGWHIRAICEHLEAVVSGDIRNLLINQPPRTMKPVGKDTLLLLENGQRIPISEIQVGDKVLTGQGRFRKVLNKFKQGKLPVLKIKTYSEREIITALDHPFLTPSGWIEAKDLRIDDVLGTTQVIDDFGTNMLPEEARLLGYLIGDGSLIKTSVNITACDLTEIEDIYKCCDKLGFIATKQQYARKNAKPHHSKTLCRLNLRKGINDVRAWTREHGINDKNSYTKRIPDKIMRGDFITIRNFLGAYFACDGCVATKGKGRRDKGVSFCSVSKDLLKDTQHLLLRLGIKSRIRAKIAKIKTKRQGGDVYINYQLDIGTQDDVYNFINLLPIFHEKLQRIKEYNIKRQRFDNRLMPDPITEIIPYGEEECYCLEVDEDHTFTANDIIVKNSTLTSVLLCAWVWIRYPERRFLYASYSQHLAERDSITCRRLIKSSWYQLRWGNRFKILEDQDKIAKFSNDKAGVRMVTSMAGSTTGEGADLLITDDPNSANDAQSEATRNSTINWWTGTWSTRGNQAKTVGRIVVQQRVHEDDISGFILKNDPQKNWVHLMLPMEFERVRKCRTVVLPSTNGKVWEDPRHIDGELLWPQQVGAKELEILKNDLGSEYNIASQLQMRPSPESGGIIKKSWFPWWKSLRAPKLELVIQSWDTALESTKANAYSACCTFGLFTDENGLKNLILLSMFRANIEYPDLRRMAIRLYKNYLDDDMHKPREKPANHKVDVLLIEAKASGISLIQDLIRAGLSPTRFDPSKYGDKIQRVRLISHILENRRVWLPARPPEFVRLRSYADICLNEYAVFPNGTSRDLVDCLTQVILKLNSSGWLSHTQDPEPEPREAAYREAPFY